MSQIKSLAHVQKRNEVGKDSSGSHIPLKAQMAGWSPEAFPPIGTAWKIRVQLHLEFLLQALHGHVYLPLAHLIMEQMFTGHLC